ncbi:MAG TPA: tetratricopeptide repeat protein [Candidatus Polarisedimenticolaceae bacterium]
MRPSPRLVLPSLLLAAGCGGGSTPVGSSASGVPGESAVPLVHLFENHSSSLVKWRAAEVRDRILVHLDGHADFDWLPDDTIARLAAARPQDLPGLELHPYAVDGTTLSRFGIWNFIYPAVRLGLVREYYWVVPDGTLADRQAGVEFAREVLFGKMHGTSVEEAQEFRFEGRTLRGTLLGVPVTVCELADLPRIDEPVLLDLDLDYFTTRSATSQEVTERPWAAPQAILKTLAAKGVRADVATISLSTIGGYFPPENRWIGPAVYRALREPGSGGLEAMARRGAAGALVAAGDAAAAESAWRERTAADPEDGSAWYALARVLRGRGDERGSVEAFAEAVRRDPTLAAADLFEGDRHWLNQNWEAALAFYRAYAGSNPASPFAPYTQRRIATCLMRLGRDDEAIETLRRVLSVAPRHGDTRLDLGVLLRERGKLDEAVAELRTAREILPDLGTYAMALGTTYLQMGKTREGIAELETAVARRPTWALARGTLAAALMHEKRFAEAAEHARLATMLNPDNPAFRRLAAAAARRAAP